MSLGVGISDILFFVDQTLTLYGQCEGAPTELQEAGRTVVQLRMAVKILGDAVGDNVSMVAKHAAVFSMIEHEMAPLETGLMEMNALLADYIDQADMGMVGRLRYAVINRNKLQGICSIITKIGVNFGLMLDLVNTKPPNPHAQDGVSGKKSDEILDKQSRQAGAPKVEANTQKSSDAELEQILEILQQYFPKAVDTSPTTEEAERAQTNDILKKIEKELVRAGVSKNKARVASKSVAEGLATDDLAAISHSPSSHDSPMMTTGSSDKRPPQPDKPSAKSGPTAGLNPDSSNVLQSSLRPLRRTAHEVQCDIRGEDSLGKPALEACGSSARKLKASETSQQAGTTIHGPNLQGGQSSRPSPLKSPKKTKDYEILIVDSVHGVPALLAHTYLEFVRVSMANSTGRWLCKGISSAGCRIETNAAMEDSPAMKQALDKLIPPGKFTWAQGFPHEADHLVRRMRTLSRRQITTTDLKTYDIVLCFNAADREYVQAMKCMETQKSRPDGLARVVALPRCQELSSLDCGNGSHRFNAMIAKIRTGIEEFIFVELDWSDCVTPTKAYRTRQNRLDGGSLNTNNPDKLIEASNLRKIEKKTGCTIRIAKTRPRSSEVLLSVNGPKEKLMEAWLLICHDQYKPQPVPSKAKTPGTKVAVLGSK